MKNPKNVKAGKLSKKQGSDFEKRVRLDLEGKGYVVDKWTNNVKFTEYPDKIVGELKPVKPMFIGGRLIMNSGGFPDFIAYKVVEQERTIIGVESKMTGKLDKIEIEKCQWLLDNKKFNRILIAEKHLCQRRIRVFYTDFKDGTTKK